MLKFLFQGNLIFIFFLIVHDPPEGFFIFMLRPNLKRNLDFFFKVIKGFCIKHRIKCSQKIQIFVGCIFEFKFHFVLSDVSPYAWFGSWLRVTHNLPIFHIILHGTVLE